MAKENILNSVKGALLLTKSETDTTSLWVSWPNFLGGFLREGQWNGVLSCKVRKQIKKPYKYVLVKVVFCSIFLLQQYLRFNNWDSKENLSWDEMKLIHQKAREEVLEHSWNFQTKFWNQTLEWLQLAAKGNWKSWLECYLHWAWLPHDKLTEIKQTN